MARQRRKSSPIAQHRVYESAQVPAIVVLAEAIGCDEKTSLDYLRSLAKAGYFIAPQVPTNSMLLAYFESYGTQAINPATVIHNIGKARLRWQAMGREGTEMAMSRKFIATDCEDGFKQQEPTIMDNQKPKRNVK